MHGIVSMDRILTRLWSMDRVVDWTSLGGGMNP